MVERRDGGEGGMMEDGGEGGMVEREGWWRRLQMYVLLVLSR